MSDSHPYNSGYEELTLGDILRGAGSFLSFSLRKWYLVVLSALVFGGILCYVESRSELTYRASLTFTLNDEGDSSGGLGGLFGRAAGLGGGGQSPEKILELGRSQLIIQQVLLDSITVDGEKDRVAHHILDVYDYPRSWAEAGPATWATVRFDSTDIESMSLPQRQVIQFLYRRMVLGDAKLINYAIQPGVGIMSVNGTTINEDLTKTLIEATFAKLSNFYIDKTVAGPRKTYEILRKRTDSIQEVVDRLQYQVAKAEDASGSVFLRQDQIRNVRLNQSLQIAQATYNQLLSRTGEAEFLYRNRTPFFSVIDRPFLPLGKSTPKPLMQFGVGALLGVFLAGFVLVIWYVVRNALRTE